MAVAGAPAVPPSAVLDLDAADRLRDEWNQLAAECEGTSYFQTADWVWSWWETVAQRPPTRVACWRGPDGALEAVAAVSRGRVLVHRRTGVSLPAMTLAGSGPGDADHCGAVAKPERRADVAAWLRVAAAGRTFVADGIAPRAGIAPLGARFVERNPCPRLALGDADAPVGRSANFRAQLGRYGRRVERAGVTFDWQAPGTVRPATVNDLFELHWRLRRSRSESTTLERQHRELVLKCVERGSAERGPAAVIARKGEDVVGVLVGFWWQGCFSAYQKGWDPAYASFSIGSLLVSEAITRSARAGAHTFDFLRGTEEYKYRFGAVDVDDETFVLPAGPVGALFRARALALAARDARTRRSHS
jgi:CelD/BcsL family acetyltransferase involved in cellulose biosynthesis